MNQKEGNESLFDDIEIRNAVIRILKDRIERSIEKKINKNLRNDDGEFYINTYNKQFSFEIIEYLIEQLAEKALQLNETKLMLKEKTS